MAGIILKHDLPQLSHLAIRARQSDILFVCCENDAVYKQLKSDNKHGVVKKATIEEGNLLLTEAQMGKKREKKTI